MTIVAVAGGTGNIGLAIVEALLATGKHTVYILSRTAHPTLSATIGAPILAVDYTSVDALVTVLEAHQIHTVISGIAMHSMDGTRPHEVELIRAADKSKATKRLVSSEWGIPMKEADIGAIPSVQYKVEAQKELEKTTDVEWTVFHCGFLMDYWGIPGVKSNMVRTPLVYWLDVANNAAAIPGSGEVKGVFTHTTDVARFVAANLEREKWERATYVYGDRVTWNEFLALAEEVKGEYYLAFLWEKMGWANIAQGPSLLSHTTAWRS